MKKAYLFLADGFEEIEALATVDVLRRGGVDVTTVSINKTLAVKGAHSIEVAADEKIDSLPDELADASMLIAPGGMPGAANLADCAKVCRYFTAQAAKGGCLAAICAAPAVLLSPLGLLDGKHATAYPGFEEGLKAGGAIHKNQRVVTDGNIITANGPSSAIPFALTCLEALTSREEADGVAAGMLV